MKFHVYISDMYRQHRTSTLYVCIIYIVINNWGNKKKIVIPSFVYSCNCDIYRINNLTHFVPRNLFSVFLEDNHKNHNHCKYEWVTTFFVCVRSVDFAEILFFCLFQNSIVNVQTFIYDSDSLCINCWYYDSLDYCLSEMSIKRSETIQT